MDTIMGIIPFVLVLCIGIFLRKWHNYKLLTPIQKAYRAWKKAADGGVETRISAQVLNELILAELTKEVGTCKLGKRYEDLKYWDATTEKDGEAVTNFFNAKYAELKTKEEAEHQRRVSEEQCSLREQGAACLQLANNATNAAEARFAHKKIFDYFSSAKKMALEKWNWFSLIAVLHAKTIEALGVAEDESPENSLARRFVPFMYERLSMFEVERADSIEDLSKAGERAPEGTFKQQTALYVCFLKLYHRVNAEVAKAK